MGKMADWFKMLLDKLNIRSDDTLTQKESEYINSREIEKEDHLLVELGAYVHSMLETLDNSTMGKVFRVMGDKMAREFALRPNLREVYLLADDALKVPINKARRSSSKQTTPGQKPKSEVRLLTPAEASFAVARMKRLVTMPMNRGQRASIEATLDQIGLGHTKDDRASLLSTPITRMLLEIGMARMWMFYMCEAAVMTNKSNYLMVYLEGVACISHQQLQELIKADFLPSKLEEVSNSPGIRDRRRMLAGDILDRGLSLAELVPVYHKEEEEYDIDYPGESDHKIFPIITNPETRPSSTRPCYGVITSDYDIIFNLLVNLPRLIVTSDCRACLQCKNSQKCIYRNTITRNIVVHMKSSYSRFVKGKNGEQVEAEEPRRVFKIVPLYRAIYKALREKKEYSWMHHPFSTMVFFFVLCASKTDYCDGLPGIGPVALFDELIAVSKSPRLIEIFKNMITVDPLTYIGIARAVITPVIDLNKVRFFVIGLYTKRHATILAKSAMTPDVHTRKFTLDQIHSVDRSAHKVVINSLGEKHFKTVMDNAIWNFKYIFNGFVDATTYRDNCIELDSAGNPKYGWKNKGQPGSLGASHHINSAFITNEF